MNNILKQVIDKLGIGDGSVSPDGIRIHVQLKSGIQRAYFEGDPRKIQQLKNEVCDVISDIMEGTNISICDALKIIGYETSCDPKIRYFAMAVCDELGCMS